MPRPRPGSVICVLVLLLAGASVVEARAPSAPISFPSSPGFPVSEDVRSFGRESDAGRLLRDRDFRPADRLAPVHVAPADLPVPPDALCPAWWGVAREVGWAESELRSLDVVLHRESRCLPGVWNADDPFGGSRGLAQVNGSWIRWLRERGVLRVKEDLFDPRVNLAAALLIYRYGVERHGFGWGPWGFRSAAPAAG